MWIINGSPHSDRITQPQNFTICDFSPQALEAFDRSVSAALNSEQKLYPIGVNSLGGDGDIMCGFMSVIDRARSKGMIFSTYINSRAFSAGAIVWSYGCKGLRFIAPHAKLLYHSVSFGARGKAPEMRSIANEVHNEQGVLFEKISRHLGKPKAWLSSKLKKKSDYDWTLTAEEVEKEGIGRAYTPSYTLKVSEEFLIS